MFEVRGGFRRPARGHALAPRPLDRGLALAYVGEDGAFRETLVEFEPRPAGIELAGERATVTWEVELRPGETLPMLVTVEPSLAGQRSVRRRLETTTTRLQRAQREWEAGCTKVETDNELFDKFVAASLRDLHALMTPSPGGEIVAAGIPWYVAPFGRDSLLTACETLMLNPEVARGTLLVLARLQARADDPWRDAEPGKILHELRAGELARAGDHPPHALLRDGRRDAAVPHAWGGLSPLDLRPGDHGRASRCLRRRARVDRPLRRSRRRRLRRVRAALPGGLRNQGWKDSEDSVVHADGTLAEGPIALVEVQGYVYLAKLRIADVYEALGDPDAAERLRREAEALRAAFNEAFWDPEEGTFALALDGDKRQVRSVTSNPGHCLYCGIVEPEQGGGRRRAPDGAGHVLRLGHPHAVEPPRRPTTR